MTSRREFDIRLILVVLSESVINVLSSQKTLGPLYEKPAPDTMERLRPLATHETVLHPIPMPIPSLPSSSLSRPIDSHSSSESIR